jgi:hypothetical protein
MKPIAVGLTLSLPLWALFFVAAQFVVHLFA